MAKTPTKAMSKALGGAKAAPKIRSSGPKCAPVTRVSVSDGRGSERTVSVEKIENGYLVRESTYSDKGGYKSKTIYSKDAPTLDVKGPKAK